MSLKSLKAEIQRTATQVRERFDGSLLVLFVSVTPGRRGEHPVACLGWSCQYGIAGRQVQLFFPGAEDQAEALARALIDYAHQVERPSGPRPGAVMIQQTIPPGEAVMVLQLPEGIPLHEHAARLYDALRSPQP